MTGLSFAGRAVRRPGRRRRGAGRAGALAVVVAAGLAASGLAACATGDQAADLFAVTRSGTVPDADLTVIPRSDGTVSCVGKRHLLPGLLLIQAEDLQPELESPASHAVTLPSGPRPVMTYSVLTPGGHFSYSDDSPGQPLAFKDLSYFVTEVARQVCGLPR
ncbi:MAG TPA: hypothetical protein VHW26_07480 [Solirubrobacteraceae bacterium]|jgi:hypothetical protein|nr:hypothetical protein [Solirubrobacteraceae bacterium]